MSGGSSFIDGDKGILRYRGYPIEELAEKSTYLETAYLIIKGELPNQEHLDAWSHNITMHTMLHKNVNRFIEGFRYDAHPMGIMIGTIGALSTFYPDAKEIDQIDSRRLQVRRLIGKMPTLAAYAYRHSLGLPYVPPENELSYTANFLSMLFKMAEMHYRVNPALERALDVLFILHADHEQNCSTTAARTVGSSHCIRTLPSPPHARLSTDRYMAARTKKSSTCSRRSARSTKSPRLSRRSRPASAG